MKTINLLCCLLLFSIYALAQSDCEDKLLKFTANLDADSLQAGLSIIESIKDYEDLPYYNEIRFTSSPNNPQYFLLKKSNPIAELGFKVFDWDNIEIETKTILEINSGESLITLKRHQSGNYKFVRYSKNPDGSCMSLTLLKRKEAGKVLIPNADLNQRSGFKKLTLLKEYSQKVKDTDLPYFKEYTYVFTKGADYYFHWEKNTNLKFKIANSKRETQETTNLKDKNNLSRFHCEQTGIYYIIIYAKNPLIQNSNLRLLYDEQSRKSN